MYCMISLAFGGGGGWPGRCGIVGIAELSAFVISRLAPPHNVPIRPRPPPTRWRIAKTRIGVVRWRRMAVLSHGSGMHELVFGVADGQHRAGSAADDLLGNAAQEQMGQAGVAMRAHDDEVNVLVAR